MNDDEESLLTENKDREQIPEKLKHMNFEDLNKLKEKLGTKVYNRTIFGNTSKKRTEFKRENKNRPREMSAKKPVSRFREIVPVKKIIDRDPRFDSLCGSFDEKAFKRSYTFINHLKENDLKTLKNELKETTDEETEKKINYLVQRLENQLREEKRRKEREGKKRQDKEEVLEIIKRGEKHVFAKKPEKKILNLISQFEELKNRGKLNKHIQRLRKKNKHKNRVKLNTCQME